MIYCIADKNGKRVNFRGNKEDLNYLYKVLGKYACTNDEISNQHSAFKSRSQLNTYFFYEIRHCYLGDRNIINDGYFETYYKFISYECSFSWVYILFFINSIRRNMHFCDSSKLEQSILLYLEYWIETAMRNYDTTGAINLSKYITNHIDVDNKYLYQYMRKIDTLLTSMPNGKKTFRTIDSLMLASDNTRPEYTELLTQLTLEAFDSKTTIDLLDWD
ncbi:MAG: hypothetical protein IJ213_00290 [Bacteroidales bacterium]|nr:hypothetical protein [Bacteroidales bacterium]